MRQSLKRNPPSRPGLSDDEQQRRAERRAECAAERRAHGNGVIPLPMRFTEWVCLAVAAGLDCPVGRALYVANRKRHTWPSRSLNVRNINGGVTREWRKPTELELMQGMRKGTAERWLSHWLNGGSIEGIQWKSDAAAIRMMRQRADKGLDEGTKLRRWIRRARRGEIATID